VGRLDELALSVPVEEVMTEDGESHLRVAFSPPLGVGLRLIPIPRTRLEFLVAKRHLVELSTARQHARLVLRAAHRAAERFSDCDTQIYLSDAELVTGHGRFSNEEITKLGRVVEAVAAAVRAEVAGQPRAPWRQAVHDAWAPLVAELGASLDVNELRLSLRRGERTAVAFVALDDDDNWLTRIEVSLGEYAALHAEELDARELADEGAHVRVVSGKLELTRTGIVADGKHLGRLLEAAFELAGDLNRRSGPYRSG
jgi:hypothetical protein